MTKWKLRKATLADRDSVLRVTLAAYVEYEAIMGGERWERYRANIAATLSDWSDYACIVAERQGELLGSVLLYPPSADAYRGQAQAGDFPEVRLLAVDPGARGEGIGLALMEECMRRARAAGAAKLGLHTNEMMEAAVRMYRRMGFVRSPEFDFVPAPGVVVEGYVLELAAT